MLRLPAVAALHTARARRFFFREAASARVQRGALPVFLFRHGKQAAVSVILPCHCARCMRERGSRACAQRCRPCNVRSARVFTQQQAARQRRGRTSACVYARQNGARLRRASRALKMAARSDSAAVCYGSRQACYEARRCECMNGPQVRIVWSVASPTPGVICRREIRAAMRCR